MCKNRIYLTDAYKTPPDAQPATSRMISKQIAALLFSIEFFFEFISCLAAELSESF
jgi:hypothetical protein